MWVDIYFSPVLNNSTAPDKAIVMKAVSMIGNTALDSTATVTAGDTLPAFHGHAGNISVNYSVYGYVESNGRH